MLRPETNQWHPALKAFWIIVGGSICLLWGLALFYRLQPTPGLLHDFVQEWASAKNHLSGYPIYLELEESVPKHLGGAYTGPVKVNAHPPASVLISVPFGWLSYANAFIAWNVISLVLLVISLWMFLRPSALRYSAWYILPIATLLLTSNSLAQQVNQGQLNLVLLLLFAGAWTADRGGREGTAGMLIGIAGAIKLFPCFLGFYFLMQRRYTAVLTSVVAFFAMNTLTGVVLGWDCYHSYFFEVVPQVGEFRDYWPNASFAGFWSKWFDGSSGHVIPVVALPLVAKLGTIATFLLLTVIAGWKSWKAQTTVERDLAFGICIVAMLLASPITWDHYFVLLIPLWAFLWKHLPATFFNRAFVFSSIVMLATVYPKWIWDAAIPGDGEIPMEGDTIRSIALPWHVMTVISYQFYCLLALFVFSVTSKTNRSLPDKAEDADESIDDTAPAREEEVTVQPVS